MKDFYDKFWVWFLGLLVLFFSVGCEAEELLRRWTRDIHHSPKVLTVLVFPPIPSTDLIADAELMRSLDFAKRVRGGIMSGVNRFNEASSNTRVDPVYYTSPDMMIEFYDEFTKVQKDASKRRSVCLSWLDELNRQDCRRNASCVIFGFFIGKSKYAKNAIVCLAYYDSKMDQIYNTNAVISMDGREVQGQLEETMVALLKQACGD